MADVDKNSILKTVKDGLQIVDTFEAFDNRIMMLINTTMSELWQIGYEPAHTFEVTGYDETWDQLITEPRFNMVKTFVTESVALRFDPPSSSYALDQMKEDIESLSIRIRYEVETGG